MCIGKSAAVATAIYIKNSQTRGLLSFESAKLAKPQKWLVLFEWLWSFGFLAAAASGCFVILIFSCTKVVIVWVAQRQPTIAHTLTISNSRLLQGSYKGGQPLE